MEATPPNFILEGPDKSYLIAHAVSARKQSISEITAPCDCDPRRSGGTRDRTMVFNFRRVSPAASAA
jgi:hypothetical protein